MSEHGTTTGAHEQLGIPLPGTHPGGLEASVAGTEADSILAEGPTAERAKGRARRRLGWGFWVSIGWVALVILLALIANLLPLPSPTAVGSALPRLGPSFQHLLGTDDIGRDMLSRIIYGARISMIVGFSSIAFGMLVGGALGLLSGFYGGKTDAGLSTLANILLAFPLLVFALAIISFAGQSLFNVVIVIGIASIAPIQRIVRSSTINYANREFVLSAKALGAKRSRIIVREILPNVLPSALSFALVFVGVAIVAEGALAFLGLSVPPPTPTWGGMINEGRNVLQQDPWVSLWPSIMMFLTVLALNFAGDRLRTYFDVREGAL